MGGHHCRFRRKWQSGKAVDVLAFQFCPFPLSCYTTVVVEKTSGSNLSLRRQRRLKVIGVSVLLLGISGACLVYWIGTRSPDLSDDLSMVRFNKAESRQMGQLFGKMGLLIEDWTNDLKQPDTQATLIATTSILIALGCFYLARLSDDVGKTG
jgi:hypothetical protein